MVFTKSRWVVKILIFTYEVSRSIYSILLLTKYTDSAVEKKPFQKKITRFTFKVKWLKTEKQFHEPTLKS